MDYRFRIDSIYPIKKNESCQKPAERCWLYFYKSLQIVLTFWIVTILAITTQPWLDYWVKSSIKSQTNPSQILGQNVTNSDTPGVSETGQSSFYLKNQKIEIDASIVEGIDEEALKQGIGHHPDSVWPNEKGNVVLAGHNFDLDADNPYSKVFISLRLVEINDEVIIEYQGKTYTYQVFKKETVKPDDTTLFGKSDEWLLTFYTCDPPYTDWKRLVVQARLVKIE